MAAQTRSNYHTIQSPTQLQKLLSENLEKMSCLYFRAEWADVCKACDDKTRELADKWLNALFLEIEAEALPDVSESFEVDSVPHFVILRGHTLLSRITGAQLLLLETTVQLHASESGKRYEAMSTTSQKPEAPPTRMPEVNAPMRDASEGDEESEAQVFERCKTLMAQAPVVLFMKGNPAVPRCGFSQQTVSILNEQGVTFTSVDILQDEAVRQGMKKLNSWPTFPQLIVNGELVGGLDILKEMVQTGELKELLGA